MIAALTIAGSDSGGGAGIQADIKTFAAHGVYGASVITALTAQNTKNVTAIHTPPADFVGEQLTAVLDDIQIHAIKTGMLANADIIEKIVEILKTKNIPLVIDPVMISKSGNALLQPNAIENLKNLLIPLCTIITPNTPEAEELTGIKIKTKNDMITAAQKILKMGAKNVVIKGGHRTGENSDDLFKNTHQEIWLPAQRIQTNNTHGTGCTFSAAITANLANGQDVITAVQNAKTYITAAIAHAVNQKIGTGHGPVNHFYKF